MPFTLNTSASFSLSSSTSSGDNWGRAYQTHTTINKDGTTRTKRTQRLGEPIIEETRRWDGKGRRLLEDGSVYEKNGKGKGWVQIQGPTMKPIQNESANSGEGSGKKGTILGMTCEPSKNVVGNGNGLGNNFGNGGRIGKGTENWLNGIMGKVANDALESRGKGRILKEVESEEDSEEEYTDSEEYTSGEYTSDEEEEEEEEKPKTKKSATTTQTKDKTRTQKQQKPTKEVEKKQKPTKARRVEEASSDEDDEDDDGYEIEEVFSSDEEEPEEEKEQQKEKPQPKKPVKKQNKMPKGKNSKKSVAIA